MKMHNIKSKMIVRYVGNRIHVLFHLAGVFYFLRAKLLDYLQKYCSNNTSAADPGEGPGVHGPPPSPPKEGSRTPKPKIKKMNKIKLLQSSYRPKSYVITKIRGPTTTSADQRGAVSHF